MANERSSIDAENGEDPKDRRLDRKRVSWRYARFVVGLVLAGLVLEALNGQRNQLNQAIGELGRVKATWVLAGSLFELCSYVGLAALQRRLLRAGDVAMSMTYATGLSFASNAILSSLPGGPAFASIYAFREYRRHGADRIVSGWVLIGTVAFEALALSLVATAGVAIAIDAGASYNLVFITVATLVIFGAVDAVIWQRRWLVHVIDRMLCWSQARFRRPRRDVVELIEVLTAHLAAVKLHRRDFAGTLVYGGIFWTLDCAALAASFGGVGAPIPWRGLLLAYGIGQLAANLPITPGGLGVVEGSLTLALIAFGGAKISAVAAVLLYRIISFWSPLVIGWCCWTALTLLHRSRARHVVEQRNR